MSGWLSGLKDHADSGFQSRWNTDLTIYCRGQWFYVHKVIIAAESPFFRKACDPDSPFNEAKTGVIHLHDDPLFVQVMLVYCYTGEIRSYLFNEWADNSGKSASDWDRKDETENGYRHGYCCAYIYALADKYQISSLKIKAKDYLHRYLSCFSHCPCDDWDEVIFPKVASKVYKTTPSTDRGLRDVVLEHTRKRFEQLIAFRRAKATMDKIDGFWAEYVQYLGDTESRQRECPGCKKDCWQSVKWWKDLGTDNPEYYPCPYCRRAFTMEEWNKLKDTNYPGDDTDSSDDEQAELSAPSNKGTDSMDLGAASPATKSLKTNNSESASGAP
ncbi:hypothetical protein IWZ01DRAFT_544778 [Phyllosticta capitalensis]